MSSKLEPFLEELKKRLNQNERFREKAAGFSGTLLFTLLPDPMFPKVLRILFEIDRGEVREIKVSEPSVRPTLELRLGFATYLAVIRGNMKVGLSAVTKGKVKVVGGTFKALRNMGMLMEIVETTKKLAEEWRGRLGAILARCEFKSPHLIVGPNVREMLAGMGAKRAVIVTDKTMVQVGHVDEVRKWLTEGGAEVLVFDEVQPEPMVEQVEEIVKLLRRFKPQVIVGVGGGSVMDAAKASFIRYERPDIPLERLDPSWDVIPRKARLVLVPTTSGTGSEVTWASVISTKRAGGEKVKLGLAHRELVPSYAIVDPFFVYQLPKKLVSSTGLDALAHAVEGMLCPMRNELVMATGIRALKLIFRYLPKSYAGDREARERVHYAATLAGLTFGNSQATLCHGLGHSFGATFNVPHGWAVSVFLPYVMDYYEDSAKEVLRELAEEVGVGGVSEFRAGVVKLIREVDGYTSIAEFGIKKEDFEAKLELLVDLAKDDYCTYSGPRIPTDEELRKLYEYSYRGERVDF
jgi:alcohol dehydrogenase class IV/putative sterol carrier protein